MQVVCGVVEREGKVLICKRSGNVPYAGYWEFPSDVLLEGETLEGTLETSLFERISTISGKTERLFAFDSRCEPGARFFVVKVKFLETKGGLNGYDAAKWIRLAKIRKYRLFPDCVTIVKELQKIT